MPIIRPTATDFTGEPAYFKHVMGAAEALMKGLNRSAGRLPVGGISPAQRQIPPCASPKMLGFSYEQIEPGLLSPRIGQYLCRVGRHRINGHFRCCQAWRQNSSGQLWVGCGF